MNLKSNEKLRFFLVAIGLFYVPIWITIMLNTATVLYIIVLKGKKIQNSRDLEFIKRLKFYPIVLVIGWTGPTIHRILNITTDLSAEAEQVFSIIQVTTCGIMGLLNCLTFVCTGPVWNIINRKIFIQDNLQKGNLLSIT